MNKLTPILKLYHTANFIAESNNDGKIIDDDKWPFLAIKLAAPIAAKIQSLQGQIAITEYFTQVFIPFNFSENPPATSIKLLPENLVFFIHETSMELIRFSGINFNRKILFVSPKATTEEYIFENKKINCKRCSKNNTLTNDDLVDYLSANATLDEIQRLIQKPAGTASKLIDLKITIGANTITINKNEDLKKFHQALQANIYKKIAISFNRNSDNSLLKNFPELLIAESKLSPDIIGIISIPTTALVLNITNPANYADLNNFIVHFPSLTSKVELTVNAPIFDNNSKLFFNKSQITNPTVINHPLINNYKQVTATINNYTAYFTKPKEVTIQNGSKKSITTVNPMNTYNPQTNIAKLSITK